MTPPCLACCFWGPQPSASKLYAPLFKLGHRAKCDHPTCATKPKTFKTYTTIYRHISEKHLDRKKIPCTHAGCKKTFWLNSRMKAHVADAHGPQIHCPVCKGNGVDCEKAFVGCKSALNRHQEKGVCARLLRKKHAELARAEAESSDGEDSGSEDASDEDASEEEE